MSREGWSGMDAMTHFSTRDAARILQVPEPKVRTWARMGGIVPQPGAGGRLEFTFQELLLLRTTRALLEAGIPAQRVRRIWSTLKRQLSDDLPLTSIRILADGNRAIAWDGNAPWQPDSGQFVLDFAAPSILETVEAREAPLLEVVPQPKPASAPEPIQGSPRQAPPPADEASALSAEQWFRLGSELEAASPLEARQAYLQALELDPACADAHLNLGRLDHRAGALGAAEAHYRRAIQCTPEDATAHFNLGVLLEDRNCPQAAAEAYEQAIACDAELADAHYNLGLLLEKLGRRADAMRHLMAAHRLYAL